MPCDPVDGSVVVVVCDCAAREAGALCSGWCDMVNVDPWLTDSMTSSIVEF